MGDKMSYAEYENMYPETVVIRKEGYFYMVRNESAAVIHAFFHYRGWKSSTGMISIGFSINALDSVCNKLEEESITYVVLDKGELVRGQNYEDENRFQIYSDTDVSDIPLKSTQSKEKKQEGYMLTEEEKKLCDISIKYMERLLEGHHPVNNIKIENDTILTDENVQRCFEFITNILRKVSDVSDVPEIQEKSTRKSKTVTFKENAQDIIEHMIVPKEVSVSELEAIIKSYNKDLFEEDVKTIQTTRISNWLVEEGYLVRVDDVGGRYHREATEEGKIIGITNNVVSREGFTSYYQYRFTPKAQRFIFENLPEIAMYKKQSKKE